MKRFLDYQATAYEIITPKTILLFFFPHPIILNTED